jgi:hypothetical protein
VAVGRSAQAFDDKDNLVDENLAAALKNVARRLVEMASYMGRGAA